MRKSGRRATKQEKILMDKHGHNSEDFHVVHNTHHELLIKNKNTGTTYAIKKAQ